jgi:mannitol/fructose-specific phosphotransferase system IIA component (Ntr-type)
MNNIKNFNISIALDIEGDSKEDILLNISEYINKAGLIKDKDLFYRQLIAMQQKCSNINPGKSIAFPEAYDMPINRPHVFILCRLKNAFPLCSYDPKPARIVLLILGKDPNDSSILLPMSNLIAVLKSDSFCDGFLKAKKEEEVDALFEKERLKINADRKENL